MEFYGYVSGPKKIVLSVGQIIFLYGEPNLFYHQLQVTLIHFMANRPTTKRTDSDWLPERSGEFYYMDR